MSKAIERNKHWSQQLGWTPDWFGCQTIDDALTHAIGAYQRSLGLDIDGICGPMTWRRRKTENDAEQPAELPSPRKAGDLLIKPVAALGNPLTRGFRLRRSPIRSIMLHWDVCLNAKAMLETLRASGWATNYVIDNGTPGDLVAPIYRILPDEYCAYHSGTKRNDDTLAIDISNAVMLKCQAWYERHGYGRRPLVSDVCHGKHCTKDRQILGMYSRQINALRLLLIQKCAEHSVPFTYPKNPDGSPLLGFSQAVLDGEFQGVINHFHVKKNKFDVSGLPYLEIFQDQDGGAK